MPPRERFYAATTGSRAPPGNARAPHKANESRRVHEGRRSRLTGAAITTGILKRKHNVHLVR